MKMTSRRLSLLASCLALSLSAQTESAPPPPPDLPVAAPDTANDGNARQQRQRRNAGGNMPNFNPAEMQARIMENLRERFEVKDDAEWAVISERLTAVMELRRSEAAGAFGALALGFMNRAALAGGGGNGNNRITAMMGGSPEQDALRSALADNLPEAEITARLAKLREARKQHEAKLSEARENLRAVLTVRQEALAVMLGLLN
jgi:hypothetical protein